MTVLNFQESSLMLRSRPAWTLLMVVCVFLTSGIALAAGPVYWDYPEHAAFDALDGDGVALDEYGRLVPGLAVTELLSSSAEVFWSLAVDDDGVVYAGCGHEGRIWRIDDDGQTVLSEVPEPEIFSLLLDRDHVWAGGGPDGLLYRINEQGEAEVWADLPEGYIWSLAGGDKGEVYLGVGSPAAVYVVRGRHAVERLAVLPAANTMKVLVREDGTLLVATQGPGLLYSLDPNMPEQPRLLAEVAQDEVRCLVTRPGGCCFALAVDQQNESPASSKNGNSGTGEGNGRKKNSSTDVSALYRIDADGLVTSVWSGKEVLSSLVWQDNLGWLAAGNSGAASIGNEAKPCLMALGAPGEARVVATWDGGDVLSMGLRPDDDGGWTVLATTAYPGCVLSFSDATAGDATAIAAPIDAGRPIHWGRLLWRGEDTGDARLEWSVRGGPRASPDETWTDWSSPWSETDHLIDLPPSRYLQWRVQFSGSRSGGVVEAVTISGRETNLPPTIHHFEIAQGSSFTEGGLHGHDGNITESFPNGLRVEYDLSSRKDRRASMQRVEVIRPVRILSWLANDPNGDRLEFQLACRRLDEESWRRIGDATPELLGSWDTSQVPDGRYVLRLTATDRLSNPHGQALQSQRLSAPMTVDNTEPGIDDFSLRRTEAGFRVSFKGEDATSLLAEAWLELPDGSSERFDPVDMICDSKAEKFDLTVPWPPANSAPGISTTPEPWRVKVILADRPGNLVVAEGEVR